MRCGEPINYPQYIVRQLIRKLHIEGNIAEVLHSQKIRLSNVLAIVSKKMVSENNFNKGIRHGKGKFL